MSVPAAREPGHPTVDRPVATVMVVAAVIVFGWISLAQLPVSLMPELSYPTLTVRVDYTGAAPEEVEDGVARPIEEIVRTVEGVVGVTSVSRAGSAEVILRFRWGVELDVASQKVRERLDLLTFPEAADRPEVLRYDPDLDPVLTLALSGDAPVERLRALAEDELQRAIEGIAGVAMVRVRGGPEEVVQVAVSEIGLQRAGITIERVEERLRAENVNVAGGRLADGERELLVRTLNELVSLDELRALAVASRDGVVVRMDDVAEVERTHRPRRSTHRIDGREAIEIAVFKEADANLVAVAEQVKEVLFGVEDGGRGRASARRPGLASGLPEGFVLDVLSDPARYVRDAIGEVARTAALGGLCAVLVLLLFLGNLRATAIVALAIPLSVVAAFVPMRLFGLSLNLMTLGGLALGVGMLVDNAIVVLEAIVRRQEEGLSARAAAIRGSREVAGAVTASTLTTLAVFVPIAFLDGIAGQLFGDLAMAVVLALLASLVFALLFVPAMAALPGFEAAGRRGEPIFRFDAFALLREDVRAWRARAKTRAWRMRAWLTSPLLWPWWALRTLAWLPFDLLGVVFRLIRWPGVALLGLAAERRARQTAKGPSVWRRLGGRISETYGRAMGRILRRPGGAVLLVLALGIGAVQIYPEVGLQLLPELAQGELRAELRMPVGTPLADTLAVVERVERRLLGVAEIDRVASFVGVSEDALDRRERGEHMAELTVTLSPTRELGAAEERVMVALRQAMVVEPALSFELRRPMLFSLDAPVAVHLYGRRTDALQHATTRVVEAAGAEPLLRDVRTTMAPGYPEVRIVFDRARMAALGLDVRASAETLRRKVQGVRVSELRGGERTVDVEVSVASAELGSLEALMDLPIGHVSGQAGTSTAPSADLLMLGGEAALGGADERTIAVPLRAVASVEVARGPAEIRRIEGRRASVVEARVAVLDVRAAREALVRTLDAMPPVEGVRWEIAGQSAELEAAQRSLLLALLVAVFLVYVVMASTFESFRGPLVILLTVPLALAGVLAALFLLGLPLSVVAGIGVIVLVGIVVNNAIVLVDAARRLESEGLSLLEATREACTLRLRPVCITAATTVLGLVPMALGLGAGVELRQPLAWVVIAGLAVGTVLTLIVIPVFWVWSAPGRAAESVAAERLDEVT